MAGLSDFDDPEMFGSDDVEYASDSPLDLIKDNLPKIIAVIAILAVAYFAYDYFIASVKEVNISVVDAEGDDVKASVKIYATGGEDPIHKGSGKDSFSFQIRAGEYSVKVEAPGYDDETESLTVSREENSPMKVVLEKDISIKITGFNPPAQIIKGQTIQVPISFENKSSKTETIFLVFEEDGLNLESAPQEIIVPGNGTAQATVVISVPDGFDAGKSGKEAKIKARIKYLKEDADADIEVKPAPDIELAGDKPEDFSANAGEFDDTEKIKIENNSKFDITDLVLEIEITDTENNKFFGEEKIREWFQFVPNENSEKWKVNIPVIEEREDLELNFYIKPPITAQQDIIVGNFVLTADYLAVPKKTSFQLEIKKSADVQLTVKPKSSLYDFEIELDSVTGEYEIDRDQYLEVENDGSVSINNINVVVSPNCEDWIEFQTTPNISSLSSGDDKTIFLNVSAPSGTMVGTTIECEISYFYDDPLGGPRKQGTTEKRLVLSTSS